MKSLHSTDSGFIDPLKTFSVEKFFSRKNKKDLQHFSYLILITNLLIFINIKL